MLICNFVAATFLPVSPNDITDEYNVLIQPSGWAFSIWGPIFIILGVFTIYQAIPSRFGIVKSRNDDFIFNKIGWLWSMNWTLCAIWLFVFQSNTVAGFVIAEIIIASFLALALIMTYKSGSNKLNCIEIFSFRVGISIYTGWLSAATILGASIMFSALGMTAENGYDE